MFRAISRSLGVGCEGNATDDASARNRHRRRDKQFRLLMSSPRMLLLFYRRADASIFSDIQCMFEKFNKLVDVQKLN